MSATTSFTQPSPQGEGFHVRRIFGKTSTGLVAALPGIKMD